MSNPSQPHQSRRPSGGERVFSDDEGRLWSAAPASGSDGAVVFTCISDPRLAVRALAVEAALRLPEVADETLRAWLREAPRMGRLT